MKIKKKRKVDIAQFFVSLIVAYALVLFFMSALVSVIPQVYISPDSSDIMESPFLILSVGLAIMIMTGLIVYYVLVNRGKD